jgi:hypothetical protein
VVDSCGNFYGVQFYGPIMLRFVILTHDHPFWHWDLMLEQGGSLKTWRLDAEPAPAVTIKATLLPVHRLHYLEYEGPVSGDRGEVHRWDHGWYEMLEETGDSLVIRLAGTRLQGTVRIQDRDGGACFSFAPDAG